MHRITIMKILLIILYARSKIRSRHYLTRPSLLPATSSPAFLLLKIRDNSAYICTMGLDCKTFDFLLSQFETFYPLQKKLGRHRVFCPQMTLALVLHWLNSTMRQKTLCQIFGGSPALISFALNVGLDALDQLLRRDNAVWKISWPSEFEMATSSAMILYREPQIKGVFGFVDGLNLPTEEPRDAILQNAYYNGWLSGCYVSQVRSTITVD